MVTTGLESRWSQVSQFLHAVANITVDNILFFTVAAVMIHTEHGASSAVFAVAVVVPSLAKRWLP